MALHVALHGDHYGEVGLGMKTVVISDEVFQHIRQLATGGKFKPGSSIRLVTNEWEVEVDDDVYKFVSNLHQNFDRGLRIFFNLPGGRDN